MPRATPAERCAGLLVALAVGLISLAPAAAVAQAPQGQVLKARLDAISPTTGPGHPLTFSLLVANTGDQLLRSVAVSVQVHARVTFRSQIAALSAAATLDSPVLTSLPVTVPAADLPPAAQDRLKDLSAALPAWLGNGQAGAVLPLTIWVSAGGYQTKVSTFAVYVSGPVVNPLGLSALVSLHLPPQRGPDGVFSTDDLAAQADPARGSLGALARLLAARGAPPLTLAVDGLLAEEAAVMARGGWRLRTAGGLVGVPVGDRRSAAARAFLALLRTAARRPGAPVLALPYAGADLAALQQNGLGADAGAALARSARALRATLGATPDPSVAAPRNGLADAPLLRLLRAAGAQVVVLDPRALPAEPSSTQNATVQIAGATGIPPRALVPDAALSEALTSEQASSDPVVWAQRVLAETAVAWLELPGGDHPTPRGVLLTTPAGWAPGPAFLSALLRGLALAPWLRVEPVQALAGVLPGPDAGTRQLDPVGGPGLPAPYVRQIATARSAVASYARAVATPATAAPELAGFDRDLLLAASADWAPAQEQATGSSYVQAVQGAIHRTYKSVQILRNNVTLTAHNGTIPITVVNGGATALHMVVRLSSAKVGLTSSASDAFVLGPKSGTTRSVRVRTATTGTFPIEIEVVTPDGRVRIAAAELIVRSTAFNRIALVLVFAAAGFLVIWRGLKLGARVPPARRRGGP